MQPPSLPRQAGAPATPSRSPRREDALAQPAVTPAPTLRDAAVALRSAMRDRAKEYARGGATPGRR